MYFKRSLVLIGALLTPLLIGSISPQFAQNLRIATTTITGPFQEFQHQTTRWVKIQIGYLIEWPKLQEENKALTSEVQKLKSELLDLDETKHKIVRLESLLKLKENFIKKGVVAQVIGRDPSHWSQFIVINKGSRDGVKKNTVLVNGDGLVGKVVASGPHWSRAILLTDSEARASALNQRTRDVGLIEGIGSLSLKMTYLDHHSDIQVGDKIISSGLGGIYPKGIPIGKVELVGKERDKINLYASVKPFVSFAKLEEVLCIPSQTKG